MSQKAESVKSKAFLNRSRWSVWLWTVYFNSHDHRFHIVVHFNQYAAIYPGSKEAQIGKTNFELAQEGSESQKI